MRSAPPRDYTPQDAYVAQDKSIDGFWVDPNLVGLMTPEQAGKEVAEQLDEVLVTFSIWPRDVGEPFVPAGVFAEQPCFELDEPGDVMVRGGFDGGHRRILRTLRSKVLGD